jgi:hypothetical protein
MSRSCRLNPTILLTLGSVLMLGPSAIAQPSAPSGPPAQKTAANAPDESAETADRFPILAITSVEILHSKLKPEINVVAVRGLTSSEGWSEGELVPLEHGAPADGVLDLVFEAQAPQESVAPSNYQPMHAILALESDFPIKAVRVRSATNSVLLADAQATTEAKAPAEPCAKCVGRFFVAKGATPPAGLSADQVVREDALPPNTRIIRATDGISDVSHNPNRLTILIGEDGHVIDAGWE